MAIPTIFELLERSIYEAVRVIAVGEGYTPDVTLYADTASDYAKYKVDLNSIHTAKGFALEVFNNSQPEQKGVIETARISIVHGGTPQGDIGLPVQKDNVNYAQSTGIVVGTTLTNEYMYDVFITARNLQEFRVCQGLVLQALPSRSWVGLFEKDEKDRFLNIMEAGYPSPSELRGVKEYIYSYRIPDVVITPYTETEVINLKEYSLELKKHLGI